MGGFQQELKLFRNLKGHRNQCKVESVEVNVKLPVNYFAIHTSLMGARFQFMEFFNYSSEEVFWAATYEQEQKILAAAFFWLTAVL